MIYQDLLFNREECDLIRSYVKLQPSELAEYFKLSDNFNLRENNRMVSSKTKTSYNVFLIKNISETEWMFNKLLEWFSLVNNVKINYKNKIEHCTLHQYKIGDSFSKHMDLIKGFDTRRYNLGIQLNDSYEGGEYLCWDNNNKEILISKKTGTAISYHCRIWHEIKEITSGERWSVVMPIKNHHIIEERDLI